MHLPKKTVTKKAFSLTELSIVLLIVALIVSAVTGSTILVKKVRISSARTITQSSPVSSIRGLIFWIDSTSLNSFNDDESVNESEITNWYDINPQSTKVNLSSSGTARPLYDYESSGTINYLPTIRFDENDVEDFMSSTDDISITNQSTIFAVIKTGSSVPSSPTAIISKAHPNPSEATLGEANFELSIGSGTPSGGFHYNDSDTSNGNRYSATATIETQSEYIISVVYRANDATNGIRFFQNGSDVSPTNKSTSGNYPAIASSQPLFIGKNHSQLFTGNIGEIIVYDRALKDDERQDIEDYLGKKWAIKINR